MATCIHCGREIVLDPTDGWVDPEATGDDSVWRETCDSHDTFEARHGPGSSAKIVWSPEKGWHDDGPEASLTLDDQGRIVINPTEEG